MRHPVGNGEKMIRFQEAANLLFLRGLGGTLCLSGCEDRGRWGVGKTLLLVSFKGDRARPLLTAHSEELLWGYRASGQHCGESKGSCCGRWRSWRSLYRVWFEARCGTVPGRQWQGLIAARRSFAGLVSNVGAEGGNGTIECDRQYRPGLRWLVRQRATGCR